GASLARMSLARIYLRVGELDRALEQLSVVGQSAKSAVAYLSMADIYERRKESSNAERAILLAVEAEPTNPTARYRLAQLYDTKGLGGAREAWDRYLAASV